MFLSIVPFLYSKRAVWTGGLASRDGRLNVLSPLQLYLRLHNPLLYHSSKVELKSPRHAQPVALGKGSTP